MSENNNQPIIVCKDVHKWYGEFHALRGVDMEVAKGEVIVIFGPSGSGKSTFIRTINRLEEHQRGSIEVNGIELSHDVRNIEKIREETGMVFQQFNLFPHISVLQNVTPSSHLGEENAARRGGRAWHGVAYTGGNPRTGPKIPRPAFWWSAAACGNRACPRHAA